MIIVSALDNWQLWWTVTISPSCEICIQWVRFKIECKGTVCSKPKPQKSALDHMCISACSSSISLSITLTIPILYHYWRWEMVCLRYHKENKGMVEPKQKSNSPYKDTRASTKHNVMHLVEQQDCAVLRIISPRCNHHCWPLLPSTETSCRRNPRKTTNKSAWSDATPR